MERKLTNEGFTNGLALLFGSHPKLKPEEKTRKFVLRAWHGMFADIEDDVFIKAVARFIMEHKDIYPGCSFIAHIRDIAKPKLSETEGDCVELAFQAVSKFGYMRGGEAMQWLKEKSPLVAAAVKRISFRELCMCENQEVVRGQLRAIFKAEKERSLQLGQVVESATDLKNGLPEPKKSLAGLLDNMKDKTSLK